MGWTWFSTEMAGSQAAAARASKAIELRILIGGSSAEGPEQPPDHTDGGVAAPWIHGLARWPGGGLPRGPPARPEKPLDAAGFQEVATQCSHCTVGRAFLRWRDEEPT